MILLTINHQSLIATKANRIVRAAQGRAVMEFGSRRAQGYSAATIGARAAYIGGVAGTACTISDELYGVPALGTMAHSWYSFLTVNYEAFYAYAKNYPTGCTLLVDTYNVLKSGIPNAIKVFDEVLKPMGARPKGVRIDSGDITYLSKKCRKMLDDAGYPDCQIVASNSLDEYIIRDMLLQGAKIDMFGVGERLITSKSEPVFGGVYNLWRLKIMTEILFRRLRLVKMLQRLQHRDLNRCIDYIQRATAVRLRTLLQCTVKLSITTNRTQYLIPNIRGRRKLLRTFIHENC